MRERVCMCVNVCGSPRKKGKLEKKWEYPENKKRDSPEKCVESPGKENMEEERNIAKKSNQN